MKFRRRSVQGFKLRIVVIQKCTGVARNFIMIGTLVISSGNSGGGAAEAGAEQFHQDGKDRAVSPHFFST